MGNEPKVVWELGAELGEGPVWVQRDKALWFVDIKKKEIHRYDPLTSDKQSWNAPEEIGFILPAERGGFVAGLQSGLHHFDEQTGAFELIVEVEPDKPGNRLNDGVVDPAGRLWFGTMDNQEKEKTGAFYCFVDGRLEATGIEGIAITNGPAVSPDGRILYFVDTLKGTIEAADIRDDGSLGARRAFARIDPRDGHPDGPTIDSNGYLWISLYAGWEALRYSPSGDLVERVRFPVANITKIAFGGHDLRSAYATTARQLLTPEEIAEQPQIGDLFEFRVDVPGVPCPLVRY
ncbi:MAG TPA: SMP-30/gluconolactonase/LRE family protein [Sphingomicrobium sp.]|jgi:sugar lactone lactonase YvrE|nr:SMP-30/gluconolactonase/LRE family protein [Sphingomicrobium sp.]